MKVKMNQSMRRNGTDEKIKQFVLETFHVLYFTARRIFEPLDFLILDIMSTPDQAVLAGYRKGYDAILD